MQEKTEREDESSCGAERPTHRRTDGGGPEHAASSASEGGGDHGGDVEGVEVGRGEGGWDGSEEE